MQWFRSVTLGAQPVRFRPSLPPTRPTDCEFAGPATGIRSEVRLTERMLREGQKQLLQFVDGEGVFTVWRLDAVAHGR